LSTLILKTRLQILRRNLEDVMKAFTTINSHRSRINALLQLPAFVESKLQDVDVELVNAGRGLKTNNMTLIKGSFEQIERSFADIRAQSAKAQGEVDAIGMRPASEQETEDLKDAVSKGLAYHAANRIKAVKRIEDKIPGGDSRGDGKMKKVWGDFAVEVLQSRRVFAEYFDFLGGLALRDSGFDQGICRTADELIGKFKKEVGWLSPTLPARQVALDRTLARIIRMGFPEWTLWALPLAAHEVGHIVLMRDDPDDPELSRLVRRARDKPELQILLADVFATYVMGPAYACAEILMTLDISAGDNNLSRKRAQVMLATLEHMNSEALAESTAYTPMITLLADEWRQALALGGIEYVQESPATVKDWVQTVAGAVSLGRGASLQADVWPKIEQWSSQLAEGKGAEIQLDQSYAQLRYLLNAAWHRRATSDMDPADILKQLDVPWIAVLAGSWRTGGGGAPSARGSSPGGKGPLDKGLEPK
jgi:hypothetical protein